MVSKELHRVVLTMRLISRMRPVGLLEKGGKFCVRRGQLLKVLFSHIFFNGWVYNVLISIAKKTKRSVAMAAIETLSDVEADSEQEIKNATLKEVSTLMLPNQVNSLVEA